MAAHNMKPEFKTISEYRNWNKQWRIIYSRLTSDIRKTKSDVVSISKSGGDTSKKQKALHYNRIMAWKMMSLLDEAKERWKRILLIKESIEEQNKTFPMEIENCRTVDFHFNKASLEYPEFMPVWVLKTKGKSYYVSHVNAMVAWDTRETPEGSTKGMIRLRNCNVRISQEGEATLIPINA